MTVTPYLIHKADAFFQEQDTGDDGKCSDDPDQPLVRMIFVNFHQHVVDENVDKKQLKCIGAEHIQNFCKNFSETEIPKRVKHKRNIKTVSRYDQQRGIPVKPVRPEKVRKERFKKNALK